MSQRKYLEFSNIPNLDRKIKLLRQKWYNFMDRCYNKNNEHDYYGRITVCDSWRNDSSEFIKWGLLTGYNEGDYIDRIDPNGNYEPSNCRWVDFMLSQQNKRNTNLITYQGVSLYAEDWSNALGYSRNTVYMRINEYGYDPITALEKGVHKYSLYPHQIKILGSTYKHNKVAYYLDMGL